MTPSAEIYLAQLRAADIFAGVSDDDLRAFTQHLKAESFPPDTPIIHEGETGDRLYIIVDGTATVEKKVFAKDGITHECIAILKPGESFGEMELVDMQPRSATVRAREHVHVLSLTGSSLHRASGDNLRTFSLILMNIARELSLRLRSTDGWLAGSLFNIRKGH